MDLGLDGRGVIVTGGSSGIGLAAARLLVDEGAVITICGRDPDRLSDAEARLGSDRVRAVRADVIDPAGAARVVEEAVDHAGRLDGVAAVAGRGRRGSLLDLDPAEVIDEVVDKLSALLNVVRPAVPHLRRTEGSIVGLTAPTANEPDPAMGAIGAGRAALANALRALAIELASDGIRVNAVGVGLIDTPRQRERHAAGERDRPYPAWLADEASRRDVPIARAGRDVEVATAIVTLLSPRAGYTTGATLDVTGGRRSR